MYLKNLRLFVAHNINMNNIRSQYPCDYIHAILK